MPNINAVDRFARVPQIEKPRSIFRRPSKHKTSFDVGTLVPIYVDTILPGDTVKMRTSKVVRLQTMLTPIMDNLYLDVFWFFVPMRLTWIHTKEFFGENSGSAWIPQVTYKIPSISAPSGGFAVGGLADHLGIPTGINWSNTAPRRPMALPFRAYALICNEYFRSENITDPLNIPTGDTNQTGSNGTDYINDTVNGGALFKVAKYFDRFTGALPSPQKGPNVTFPLLEGQRAPVGTLATSGSHSVGSNWNTRSLWYRRVDGLPVSSDGTDVYNYAQLHGTGTGASSKYQTEAVNLTSPDATLLSTTVGEVFPINLWTDLSQTIGAVTVNQMRLAFQLQRYYESIARSGSRYRELILGLFGCHSDDARMQVPEYLGGNRVPIQIHEVINQAQATNDYLGDLGAMSHTADVHYDFEKSFTEHGFLMGLACVRYDHSYAQGIERFWSRLDREEWYIPQFANISEQPLFQDEICATDANMATANVFGYQEAWSDLRYKQDIVTGEMRPGISNTLSSWHLSDYYAVAPTLSDAWLREDKTIVDRVLAVGSSVSNQLFGDFYFDATYTRVLPMYSVPGLIDHY